MVVSRCDRVMLAGCWMLDMLYDVYIYRDVRVVVSWHASL